MSLYIFTIIAVSTLFRCILAWGGSTAGTTTTWHDGYYNPYRTLTALPPSPTQLAFMKTPQITPSSSKTGQASLQPRLSTTFTPPRQCQTSLARLRTSAYQIWYNPLVPVPNRTISECYPSEFASVMLRRFDSTTLPAFSPLVCPEGWSTAWSSDTQTRCDWSTVSNWGAHTACIYIVCCPQ